MSGTEVLSLIGLAVFSTEDLRTKQVSVIGIIVFGAALLLVRFLCGGEFLSMALATLPGLFALLFSVISGEQIGLGDGLILFVLGFGNGIERMLGMLAFGLLFAGMWAGALLVIRHSGRKQTFPFLPFLLLGYGMALVVG